MNNNTSLKVLDFAGYTLLYYIKQNTYKKYSAYLNVEIESISKWLMINNFKFNLEKTGCMLFHVKTNFWKNINFHVIIGISIITKVNNYKYLGVIKLIVILIGQIM